MPKPIPIVVSHSELDAYRQCECGCGGRAYNRFIQGHNSRVAPSGYSGPTGLAPVEHPTMLDIAWLAGFLEGDGTFYRRQPTGSKTGGGININVHQVNQEPLERLLKLFGGKIYQIPGIDNHSPKGSWMATGGRAIGIMQTVWPLMSRKRRAQIVNALGKG